MRGCRCPAAGGTPRALKLYDLNDFVLQEPLHHIYVYTNVQRGMIESFSIQKCRWCGIEGRPRTYEAIISGVRSTSCFPI